MEEKKQLLEEEKRKAQKTLQEKEAELRKLRAERATKEEIETKEIEIMYLKKKVQQHQTTEKELMTKIIDLQEKLEATDIGKLDWIASNLEKQLEGVRPEFERERSHMMNNIYKMLKYIKIPDDLPVCFNLVVAVVFLMFLIFRIVMKKEEGIRKIQLLSLLRM